MTSFEFKWFINATIYFLGNCAIVLTNGLKSYIKTSACVYCYKKTLPTCCLDIFHILSGKCTIIKNSKNALVLESGKTGDTNAISENDVLFQMYGTTLFLFVRNIFYKNIEAEICERLRVL